MGIDNRVSSGSSIPVMECDILDFARLLSIVADFRPDRVFHLAGRTRPSESLRMPREFYLVNVQGTVNLLEALRLKAPEAHCLLVSSGEVYASVSAPRPVDETCPPAPANPYGSSKLLAEMAGLRYWHDFGLRLVVARPFNHSGPGQSESFVISDFCRQAVLIERTPDQAGVIAVGNLEVARDFLDVRDVVAAYVGLAEKGIEGEVYNIASGRAVAIRSVLDTVLRLTKARIRVEVASEKYRPAAGQPLIGDSGKLCRLLGWQPLIPLEQTISETLEFWRQRMT